MQYSCHLPTPFIARHRPQLVPDWSCEVGAVLIVLQRSPCDLAPRSPLTERQKYLLREAFMQTGLAIATQLRQLNYCADPFDPKTGQPLLSQPGSLWLDDVAVIRACLGYPTADRDGCSILLHPDWGSAVYPAVLLSSAPPEQVREVARSVTGDGGWLASESWCRKRSAYHHSFSG